MRNGGERRPGQPWHVGLGAAAALLGLLIVLVWNTPGGASPSTSSALVGDQPALAGVVAAEEAGVDRARARLIAARAGVATAPPAPGPTGGPASGAPRVPLTAGCASTAAGCADPSTLLAPAGLTPVRGTAIVVALDDTPRDRRAGPWPPGVRAPVADDLVVHQQDVQAVVNALWTGGARAMTLMGRRVTARTAVRCVGNTLLLEGDVYSPPFVVAALGDPARLTAALDADPGVVLYREYVDAYDLGYHVETRPNARFPAAPEPSPAVYATPVSG